MGTRVRCRSRGYCLNKYYGIVLGASQQCTYRTVTPVVRQSDLTICLVSGKVLVGGVVGSSGAGL